MYSILYLHPPPADIGGQLVPHDRDHVFRHWRVSRQPVGVVIARSVAAVTLYVTEQEGHGGETRETASCGAWETVWSVIQWLKERHVLKINLNLYSISVHKGFYALTKVLTMSSLISIDEEEGVTREDEASAMRAVGDTDALTVSGYQETVDKTWTTSAWQPCRTLLAWVSKSAIWTYRRSTSLLKNIDTF